MSRFREEIRIVPAGAWVVAVLLLMAGSTALVLLFQRDRNPPPVVFQVLFASFMALILSIYALAVGYINGDARRRGMRHVLWTLLAIFIPNAIGIILYFILRDPLLIGCPNCGRSVNQTFGFCPLCGHPVQPACPNCRRAVEAVWANCAFCGAKL